MEKVTDEYRIILESLFDKGMTSRKNKSLICEAQLQTGLSAEQVQVKY
jgi:hypothetical protein